MADTSLHWRPVTQLRQDLAARRVSPVDLVQHQLDRIARLDPEVNAFVTLDSAGALAAAEKATQEIADGDERGPLHGIPVAIKDIIDVAAMPTTCHSRLLRDNRAAGDAAVVARLRAAGAIVMGKLATWEFAYGGPSLDLPFPPARNPWNLARQPGGSSSGSGAALAAGFVPLALGTDTGGSVRHPAAACGIVGLKPTLGSLPLDGVFPLAWSLDTVGPMARSVADVALLQSVLSDQTEIAHIGEAGLSGLRIGYIRHFHDQDMIADSDVGTGLDAAALCLQQLGAKVRDVTLPALGQFSAATRIILHCEAWTIHRDWLRTRPEDYGRITRQRLATGAFLSAEAYLRAGQARAWLTAQVDAAFAEFDLLLCANALDPAGPVAPTADGKPVNIRQARTPFSLTGNPAISLMTGISRDGLPLSLQLVAKRYQERLLLQAAAAYENATGHHQMRPPLD